MPAAPGAAVVLLVPPVAGAPAPLLAPPAEGCDAPLELLVPPAELAFGGLLEPPLDVSPIDEDEPPLEVEFADDELLEETDEVVPPDPVESLVLLEPPLAVDPPLAVEVAELLLPPTALEPPAPDFAVLELGDELLQATRAAIATADTQYSAHFMMLPPTKPSQDTSRNSRSGGSFQRTLRRQVRSSNLL